MGQVELYQKVTPGIRTCGNLTFAIPLRYRSFRRQPECARASIREIVTHTPPDEGSKSRRRPTAARDAY